MCPSWRWGRRRKQGKLYRVVRVNEKWLMAPLSRRIGLFPLAATTTVTTTILRGKPCGKRRKRRISHRRSLRDYAIHALWKVGLVPRRLRLLLLPVVVVLGVVWRQYLAALSSNVAKVHLWVWVGGKRRVE